MAWVPLLLILLCTMVNPTITGDTSEEERKECGQYGFRCVDQKTVEFCPIFIDGVAETVGTYECADDYTCDEDNPAYCTPKEPPNKLLQDVTRKQQHGGNPIEDDFDDDDFDDSHYGPTRVVRSNKDEPCCGTTTQEITTTTESEDKIDFTTIDFTPAPPFECDSYGFFTDTSNSTLFWYCDVPLNGVGYLLRHMMCGHNRYFDESLKNCIMQGSVRHERKDDSSRKNVKSSMNCLNKKRGKYPDKLNCQIYHLCLPKRFSPAIELTFMCPNQTAYDAKCQSCTMDAFNRCQTKKQSPTKNKIYCRSPTRFRSLDDCNNYFLCFVDNVIAIRCPKFYKFDDKAMECLPEKVAECRELPV